MSWSWLHRANAARRISAPSAPWERLLKHLGRRFFQAGDAPLWRGDSPHGATSTHTESREAEKTSTPFRGTDRSRPSAASPSARPGAAARPPRGLCGSLACSAPGGFPGAPRRCGGGMGCVRVSGWRSLLSWGKKAGRRGMYTKEDLREGARWPHPLQKETSISLGFCAAHVSGHGFSPRRRRKGAGSATPRVVPRVQQLRPLP